MNLEVVGGPTLGMAQQQEKWSQCITIKHIILHRKMLLGVEEVQLQAKNTSAALHAKY